MISGCRPRLDTATPSPNSSGTSTAIMKPTDAGSLAPAPDGCDLSQSTYCLISCAGVSTGLRMTTRAKVIVAPSFLIREFTAASFQEGDAMQLLEPTGDRLCRGTLG